MQGRARTWCHHRARCRGDASVCQRSDLGFFVWCARSQSGTQQPAALRDPWPSSSCWAPVRPARSSRTHRDPAPIRQGRHLPRGTALLSLVPCTATSRRTLVGAEAFRRRCRCLALRGWSRSARVLPVRSTLVSAVRPTARGPGSATASATPGATRAPASTTAAIAAARSVRRNDTRECAPGCASSWLGDKECDEECNTAACRFDGGDCNGVCAPGCAEAWRHDGVCDDECNTGSCDYDSGDCLKPGGRPFARERCAWGCPSSWLADGQCDIACNVTRCGYDKGDCISGWKHRPAYGQRGRGDGMGRGGDCRNPTPMRSARTRQGRASSSALRRRRCSRHARTTRTRAERESQRRRLVDQRARFADRQRLHCCLLRGRPAQPQLGRPGAASCKESYRVINPARPCSCR